MKARGEGYERKVLRLIAEGTIAVPPGTHADATVQHHPDCPFYAGRRCRCDPDIIVSQRGAA